MGEWAPRVSITDVVCALCWARQRFGALLFGRIVWRGLVPIALIAALLAAGPAAAQTMNTEAFLASPAAQAYDDGRYGEALRALEAQIAQYPDDVTIKRVRGMALYNLERYREAAAAFRQVVALDPQNAAAHFWLGATLFELSDLAGASAAFNQAIALAPGTAYAEDAGQFLAAIEQQLASQKRLSLQLSAGLQYDDNVSLTNEETIHSPRFFEQIDASYLLIRRPGWFVAAEGGGYLSQNTSDEVDEFANRADDFDLVTARGGLDIRHETSAFGIPIAPGFNYRFDLVLGEQVKFSDIHTLEASLEANPTPDTITRPYYRFNKDFFAFDGFDSEISSRDGVRHAFGVMQYVYFSEQRHYLWAGYEYRLTHAEGVNFDARENHLLGGISLALPHELVLVASADYGFVRYYNFLGPRRRRSSQQTYSAELSRQFREDLRLALGYSYGFDDSNYAVLENTRNIATLALTWNY